MEEGRPAAPQEAPVAETEHGKHAEGPGWFVLNATEAQWLNVPGWGRAVMFDPPDSRFDQVGMNIHVLEPGEPNCRYHGESAQEDFLVLKGECLLIVEGEERRLRAWDFVHCPPWTRHVFVGAGEEPCVIVMIGARLDDKGIEYPVDETAERHGAAVKAPTTSPEEAYADLTPPSVAAYAPGDLPDFS